MDTNSSAGSTPNEAGPVATPAQQPVEHKQTKFFALFGKIVLIVIVLGGLIFGGYYLGTKSAKTPEKSESTNSAMKASDSTPTQAVTPTEAVVMKTIKGGGVKDVSFKSYTIETPPGWTDAHQTTDVSDKLTLTKNGYTLSIYQAAVGGGGCLYKGDAPHEMAQTFTDFADIMGKSAQFRRSWNQDADPNKPITYSVCQKNTTDGSYGSPTEFGAISATAANPSDAAILAEIDSIIASITKQ